MSFIQSLQTKDIFACHCQVYPDSISCGILAVNGSHRETVSVKDPATGDRYAVEVPQWRGVRFGAQLKKVWVQ